MKKIVKLFLITAATFLATEATADAQLLKKLLNKATDTETTENVTEATSNGRQAGAALKSLYTQFKADGKLDMTNLNNMLNLATLATNIKDLKGKTNKSTFYKEFAEGLISGSNNLISKNNSTNVMSGLTNLVNNVDLSSLTDKFSSTKDKATSALSALSGKTDTAIENANEIASSVSNILKLFK